MEGENQQSSGGIEDSKVHQLMGSLIRTDTLKVPVTAPLTTANKIASHGIEVLDDGGSIGGYQDSMEDANRGHASSKLLELAGSNHLQQIRQGRNNAASFQGSGQTPPRSPTDEGRHLVSPTVDDTVDKILSNTVNVNLWQTPRRIQTPSPTMDQAVVTPHSSQGDEDQRSLTPVEVMSDSDRRLDEANKEISKLTRQAFQMSAEKELVEGDLEFWKSRAYELETRLRNAEEEAIQKEEQVEELERQLDIARQPMMAARSPSTHPGSRMTGSPNASDSHHSQSINSHHSSEHRHSSIYARSNILRNSTFAQQQPVLQYDVDGRVSVDLRMKPALMQLVSALRALILKLMWRTQDSAENFQIQLTNVIKQLMQNKSVQQAWSYISQQVLPTVGWTGLSVFIVVVCTGFMQMWRQGAKTLLTWMS